MKDIAPNQSNKIVGGIRVFLQLNKTGGFFDLGTIKSHGLQRTVERGIDTDARSGVEEEVYSWLQKRGMTFEVEANETTRTALRLALMADAPVLQTQSASSVTDEAFTAKLDRWVRVAKKKISSVVLTSNPAGTTYTLGTDYEIDAELGMIRCLSTGTITEGLSLLIDYAYAAMTSLYKMNLMQTARFTGDMILKMVAENGAVFEIYYSSVEVQPKGDLAISTTEPMKTGSYSIKVNRDTTATSGTEYGTLSELTAAS